MHRRTLLLFLVALGAIFLHACGDKTDPVSALPPVTGDVTYANDIKPILDNRCIGCHSSALQGADRNGAPPDHNFDTYEGIVQWAEHANEEIQSGGMPPTGGIPLDERALFQAWIDQGMKE